jgi:hypothetical protein
VVDGSVGLQEFTVLIISNVTEDFEVIGKQEMTEVTNRIVKLIDKS